MILDKTFVAIKNNPFGFAGGAIAGYYVSKKYIKNNNTTTTIFLAFVGGIVGAGFEHIIRSKIGISKTTSEIKN